MKTKKIKQGLGQRLRFAVARMGLKPSARRRVACALILSVCTAAGGCRQVSEKLGMSEVRPRALRDVPAARLAFRLETDISEDVLPEELKTDAPEEMLASVKTQFETSRPNEALLRTVASPDGQRALALYDPGGGGAPTENTFRIDLYSAQGMFVRNILPQNLEGITLAAVSWSPDAEWIAFIGREKLQPEATPTPAADDLPVAPPVSDPNAPPVPTPTVAPFIAPVQAFKTDQIYICDRDGNNLRPLTTREGLIYLNAVWSPDARALAALACKQDELDARLNEGRDLAGRPRLIDRDGRERLLDDQLMDAPPVWSPDATKVATAFETNVVIYDAAGESPTGARLPLREPLLNASASYDAATLKRAAPAGKANPSGVEPPAPTTSSGGATPVSFNPVIRLEWLQPETLLVRTGFVHYYQDNPEPRRGYLRWHVLHLSPQAAVLN